MNSKAIGQILAVVIVVAIVLVAGFGIYFGTVGNYTSRYSTSISTSSTGSNRSTQVSTYSTVSPSGLKLELLMNATSFQQGQNISLQVALVNTLNHNLTLPVDWSANFYSNIVNWDFNDSLCGISAVEHTFSFAIFLGHYTQENISGAGSPLMLTPPVSSECPNVFYSQGYIQTLEFQPQSYSATFYANASIAADFKHSLTENMLINASTGGCSTEPYGPNVGTTIQNGSTITTSETSLAFGCGSYTNVLNGYWTMPANDTALTPNERTNSTILNFMSNLYQNYFHQFSSGSYTVVADDLWNQTVYAYFQIVAQ